MTEVWIGQWLKGGISQKFKCVNLETFSIWIEYTDLSVNSKYIKNWKQMLMSSLHSLGKRENLILVFYCFQEYSTRWYYYNCYYYYNRTSKYTHSRPHIYMLTGLTTRRLQLYHWLALLLIINVIKCGYITHSSWGPVTHIQIMRHICGLRR